MTYFLYSFPLDMCVRIWDNILVHGRVFLLKFAIVVMKHLEPRLKGLNFEDKIDILNSLGGSEEDEDAKVEQAAKGKKGKK